MNRRDALKFIATACGGVIYGADAFSQGKSNDNSAKKAFVLSRDDYDLLDEIAETIIPTNPDSPGAKAAKIGAFMGEIVGSYYSPNQQKVFSQGLVSFRERCQKETGRSFLDLSDEESHAFLLAVARAPKGKYYSMYRQLTLWGYFSSEIGTTKVRRYAPIPGRFEGCINYKKGEKSWS